MRSRSPTNSSRNSRRRLLSRARVPREQRALHDLGQVHEREHRAVEVREVRPERRLLLGRELLGDVQHGGPRLDGGLRWYRRPSRLPGTARPRPVAAASDEEAIRRPGRPRPRARDRVAGRRAVDLERAAAARVAIADPAARAPRVIRGCGTWVPVGQAPAHRRAAGRGRARRPGPRAGRRRDGRGARGRARAGTARWRRRRVVARPVEHDAGRRPRPCTGRRRCHRPEPVRGGAEHDHVRRATVAVVELAARRAGARVADPAGASAARPTRAGEVARRRRAEPDAARPGGAATAAARSASSPAHLEVGRAVVGSLPTARPRRITTADARSRRRRRPAGTRRRRRARSRAVVGVGRDVARSGAAGRCTA